MSQKKKSRVKKLKVLKVEKITDGEQRVAVEFETDAPLPVDPLPRDPIDLDEEPAKSSWTTWFKSLWTEDSTQPALTHSAVVKEHPKEDKKKI